MAFVDTRKQMHPVNEFYPLVETLANPDALIKRSFDWGFKGYEAFVGALPRGVAGKMTKADIYQAGMIWADLDLGKCGTYPEILAMAKAASPDVLVCSGGGVHAYWKVSPVIELTLENMDRFETFCRNKQIEISPKSDPTEKTNRLLRLPGTNNRKLNEPRKVVLLHAN